MKLNNYSKSSQLIARSSILKQAIVCIAACFFSWSAQSQNCLDITGGSIGSSQTICTGGNPAMFTNITSATTGQGTGVKYIWLRFVGASAPVSNTTLGVAIISGATGATYDPPAGSVTAKTWFRRCAAPNSAVCTTYYGETSWVSVSVSAPTALTCEASINGTWSTLSSCSVSACTGNSLWLSVSPNVSTVTWTGPNGFTASGNDALISNSVTTANAGTYTAALTQNGCTSTTTIQVTVTSCGVNCNDITAGSIGNNQSICTGGDPAIINSLTAATTGQGTGVKYIWLRFVGASAPASSTTSGVTTISGATGATYDPPAGSVTAKTWFRRCSAPNSATCTTYNGETTWISVDVTSCNTTCTPVALATWSLDQCASYAGAYSYTEFVAATNAASGSCASVSATVMQRNNPSTNFHSCAYGVTNLTNNASGDLAMCLSGLASSTYSVTSSLSLNGSITVTPNAGSSVKLTTLQFYVKSPATLVNVGTPATTANNQLTKVGVSIINSAGTIIYTNATAGTITGSWTLVSIDLSNIPDFTINGSQTFTIKLLGYAPATTNQAMTAWEIDDIRVIGCCSVNCTTTAAIAGTTAICSGGSTTLTASGGGTYAWNTGATTAAITVNPTANTTYTVTVTNGGCTATATTAVTILTNCNGTCTPVALATWSLDQCASYAGAYSYTEFVAATNAASGSCASVSATVMQRNNPSTNFHSCAYGVTNLTNNASGDLAMCMSGLASSTYSASSNLNLNGSITVTPNTGSSVKLTTLQFYVKSPSTLVNVGTTNTMANNQLTKVGVSITNSAGTTIYTNATAGTITSNWTLVSVDLSNDPDFTVNGSQTFTIKLLGYTPATTNQAMTAWEIDDIRVIGCCSVDCTTTASIAGTTSICSGGSTTLTASGGGTYVWSTGSTTAAITVNPTANTTYTVTVTNGGCTATATRAVTVGAASASIAGTTAICSGGSTTLTASGGGTYVWSTGSTTAAITVNPTANTTYTVTVTNGGCTATATRAVTVGAASASIAGTTAICSGGSTTLTASGGGTYVWSTGSTTAAITVNPTANTTYTVTVTNGGCTATATTVVTVGAAISSGITSPSTTCALENVLVQAQNVDATCTYSWNFGVNATPQTATGTSATTQFSAAAVGTAQTITLTVTKNGCSATFTKNINVTPEVFANAGPDKEICQGGSTQIGGNPAGPAGGTFTWSPNTFLNSNTVANPIASPPVTTTYTLTTTLNGCTRTDQVVVSVNVALNPNADAGGSKTVCSGQSVQIGGNPTSTSTGVSYVWSPANSLSGAYVANPTAYPTTNTTYTVTVTNTATGCSATSSAAVTVTSCVTPALSINDITVTEGTNPTATLQICASAASTSPITVTYTTSNGTALSGTDYTTTTATATIPAGQTCVNVTIPIIDDAINEPIETFTVTLTNPSNATIADGTGIVTILDNDVVIPTLAINDITVTEGTNPTATLQICASAASTSPITVTYTTSNGTALSGTDYTTTTATATIPAGQTCVNVTVPIIDDAINEPTENFTVTLTNPSNATIADGTGIVTILDNDVVIPTLAINDITVTEGTNPTATLQICASAASTSPITVTYTTSNGTALSGTDYTTTTATATIPAGQTCVNVTVPIIDDAINEPTENFTVTLTNPSNATIADGTGIVTILDNDPTGSTTITIGDKVFFDANNNGIQDGGSEVGLPGVTVNLYNTTGGWMGSSTTNANGLYSFSSTTISSLVPGSYRVCFNKPWNYSNVSPKDQGTDDAIDSDVNAFLSGSACTDLFTVAAGETKNTIDVGLNNGVTPTLPTLSINDITVNENAGTATLQICASATSTSPISVTYTTSNGTALSGTDYTTTTATATIPAGQTCVNVTVPITDDLINEPTETFTVILSTPTGATINDGTGIVTILDNDNPIQDVPSLSINDITVTEGTNPTATLQICASATSTSPISVTYTTSNGTAMMGTDYTTTTATATIPAGQTCVNVTIPIIDDAINEPTETFTVTLTNPSNAVIGDGTGIVTILDNDPTGSTTITIGDKVFFDANNNGIQDGGSEVGLPGVTVNLYNATGGWLGSSTSNANGLYSFSSTTISSLVAGSYRVCFNKPWNYSNVSPKDQGTDDAIDSDVNAFSGGSACTDLFTVAAGETKNTIDAGLNNGVTPTLPTLSINDITVNESPGNATLQICASATSTSPITVTYTTSNGTAIAGSDYTSTTATATIPAGQTCVAVNVPILDDNIGEPTETFTVTLTNPTGATINDGTGIVTILDNDVNCNDITGGSISGNQTICTGGDPAAINSISPATTSFSGGVKYQWFCFVGANPPASMAAATQIIGATNASYDPPAGSVTAKKWFRRCAAPNSTSCTVFGGESAWVSVDVITCTGPTCSNITNVYQVQNTLDNCGSSCTNNPYMMILFNQGGCYTANNVYLTEYNDGTAKLQGTATNNTGLVATIDVTLSGKTCTGTPYYALCTSGGGAAWCYYATMSGTISVTGFPVMNISSFMHPLQIGNGANLQSTAFGASGWFSSNGVDNQGDFNFNLVTVTSVAVTTNSICNGSTSTITATATGGRPTYTYAWSNGATTATIGNMANGTYTVTVTDANGCTATSSITTNCSTGGTCDNVTTAGSLGYYQSGAAPFDPSAIVETAAPTGGSGDFQYIWQTSSDNWSWTTISGATNISYDPTTITTSTFYRRGVRRANCTEYLYSHSVYKEVVGSGKTELAANAAAINNLTVAPVPAIDYINVLFDAATEQMVNVRVLDITGRLAITQNLITTQGSNLVSFDVTQLLPGYYIVELNNGTTKQHAKFVVMR